MAKRSKISVVFFVLLVFSILLFLLSRAGYLDGPQSIFARVFSPLQGISFSAFNFLSNSGNSELEKLKNENKELVKRLVEHENIKRDNQALRDQFEKGGEERLKLLPAKIAGAPSFLPGVTDPVTFIIDKGTEDGVRVGTAVVVKNILVGKVTSANAYISKVDILTHPSFSLIVKNQRTNANGVTKGEGGRELILDNVLQEDDIKSSDIIVTRGNQTEKGVGIPPDIIVGKVLSIDKKPSEVFQKGKVESPLEFSKLSTVFVVTY